MKTITGQPVAGLYQEPAQVQALDLFHAEPAGRGPQLLPQVVDGLAQLAAQRLGLLFVALSLFGQALGQVLDLLAQPRQVLPQQLEALLVIAHLGAENDVADALHVPGTGG